MEHRRQKEWLGDAESRQSNVLPLDTAKNEARLWAALINGKGRLNFLQRVGGLVVSLPAFVLGVMILCLSVEIWKESLQNFDAAHHVVTGLLLSAIVEFAVLLMGIALVWFGGKALRNCIGSMHR